MASGWDKAGDIITKASQTFVAGIAGSRGGNVTMPSSDAAKATETTQAASDKVSKDLQRPRLLKKYEDTEEGATPSTRISLSKGGRISKTGVYRLHKGEVVVPAKIVSRKTKSRKSSRSSSR